MLWWFCSQSSIRDIGTELMWLICKKECYFTWLMFIILNLFMAQLFKFIYHGRYQNCQTLRLASSTLYICTFINSTKRQRDTWGHLLVSYPGRSTLLCCKVCFFVHRLISVQPHLKHFKQGHHFCYLLDWGNYFLSISFLYTVASCDIKSYCSRALAWKIKLRFRWDMIGIHLKKKSFWWGKEKYVFCV